MADIVFEAPPTIAAFMKSQAFGRMVAGPVGSGKTTGCLFELFRRACEQAPAPDGLRYTRFAITRQTLKQLKDTVLKDITSWLKGIASYKVSENCVYITIGDVRSEWLLIPLEDSEDRARLLSMQLTGAWMSEAIEQDTSVIGDISGRCGRYPGPALGGASWFGIIADTNMPSEGSEWHKFMSLETPPDWQIFIQPGGMLPEAENLAYLTQSAETLKLPVDDPKRIAQGRKYYERLVTNNTVDWVKRYVHAQFGDDPSGTAVFRDSFRMGFHVEDELQPVPGHPLLIGQDFGRDPCSIICQVDHKGRLLVLEEVIAEDTGLETHIDRSLKPVLMQPRYLSRAVAMVGDPAGRAKGSIYEETSFDALKRLGFAAFPAPSNDLDPRIRAVEAWLTKQIDGRGAMLIDRKRCPTLIRAMNGAYRFGKTTSGQRKPKPEKSHPWSDIADSLQYACMAAHGRMTEMMARHMFRKGKGNKPKISAKAWT